VFRPARNCRDLRGFFSPDKEVATTRTNEGTLEATDEVWWKKDRKDL